MGLWLSVSPSEKRKVTKVRTAQGMARESQKGTSSVYCVPDLASIDGIGQISSRF